MGLFEKNSLFITCEDTALTNLEFTYGGPGSCRPLEVNDSEGCKLFRNGSNPHFLLNKSVWFPAALLSTPKVCVHSEL